MTALNQNSFWISYLSQSQKAGSGFEWRATWTTRREVGTMLIVLSCNYNHLYVKSKLSANVQRPMLSNNENHPLGSRWLSLRLRSAWPLLMAHSRCLLGTRWARSSSAICWLGRVRTDASGNARIIQALKTICGCCTGTIWTFGGFIISISMLGRFSHEDNVDSPPSANSYYTPSHVWEIHEIRNQRSGFCRTKTSVSRQIWGARSSRSVHPNPRVETHLFSNNAKSLDIDRLHLKIAWGIRNWPRALGLQANFLNAVVKIRNPRGLVKVSGFLIHKIGCISPINMKL